MKMNKVPSLKEVRQICKNPNEKTEFVFRRSGLSTIFTWILLHTNLTPNQITALWVFFGLLGVMCYLQGTYWWGILGIGLLIFGRIFDYCDGEVARYTKKFSKKGYFLDWAGTWAIELGAIMFISVGLFISTQNLLPLFVGLIAMFGYSMKQLVGGESAKQNLTTECKSDLAQSQIYKLYKILRKISLVEYFTQSLFIFTLFGEWFWFLMLIAITNNLLWFGKVVYESLR